MREEYRTLNNTSKAIPSGTLSDTPKKISGWQKFKNGLSKVWNVIKSPVKSIIGALPFGN